MLRKRPKHIMDAMLTITKKKRSREEDEELDTFKHDNKVIKIIITFEVRTSS